MQAPPPVVTARVDRLRVTVGEVVTYRVTAESRAADPLVITVPPPDGFEILDRSERSDVKVGAAAVRSTVVELRLLARRAGRWIIGPAVAEQGGQARRTLSLEVQVVEAAQPAPPTLSAGARALLARADPPRPGEVAVTVLVAGATARVGEQVDVVTAAWFPRELRLRLRRPPTLQPPVLDGMWTAGQSAPVNIAASREVGGQWYDLFVLPQVAFGLRPGPIRIGAATLTYAVPTGSPFYQQEERFVRASRPVDLTILPLPEAGRPAGFAGAVGRGLTVEVERPRGPISVGRPVRVAWRLAGEGNVALWPAPAVAWPAGVRAYVERTDEQLRPANGRVGGTKRFSYVVVADSAGVLAVPAVTYPYFDDARGVYVTATAEALTLPVTDTPARAAAPAAPLPLLQSHGAAWTWRLARAAGWPGLAVAAMLPPLLAIGWRRRRREPARPAAATPGDGIDRLATALRPLAGGTVPATETAVRRLRGLGLAEAAERVGRVWPRVLSSRYGGAPDADPAELEREAGTAAHAVQGVGRGTGRPRGLTAVVLLGALAQGGPAGDAAAAYASGAYESAAGAWQDAARAAPGDAALRYNLGAARRMAGDDAGAAAAWLAAARLAPRNSTILRASASIPAPDAATGGWRAVSPVTPEEAAVLALVAWAASWWAWARGRRRVSLVAAALAAALAVAGGVVAQRYLQPIAFARDNAVLRVSPHARAPLVARPPAGTALVVVRSTGAWRLVEAAGQGAGWVPAAAVVPVGE